VGCEIIICQFCPLVLHHIWQWHVPFFSISDLHNGLMQYLSLFSLSQGQPIVKPNRSFALTIFSKNSVGSNPLLFPSLNNFSFILSCSSHIFHTIHNKAQSCILFSNSCIYAQAKNKVVFSLFLLILKPYPSFLLPSSATSRNAF